MQKQEESNLKAMLSFSENAPVMKLVIDSRCVFYATGLSHEKIDTALYHIIPTKNDIHNEGYFMIDTIFSLSHQ